MIKDPDGSLQKVIESAVAVLRKPAGKKYHSMEDIRRNRDQFVKDFHSGLFLLHIMTIHSIIDAEDKMRMHKSLARREAMAAKKGWTYIRQLFRCINDAIVWTALQACRQDPSLIIQRTCQKQPKGNLKDQNHESVIKAMQHYYVDGEKLPIWNDTTRCLDINDITLFSPHGITFIELKEGKVNQHIIDMMEKTNPDEILTELDTFFEKYGQKGMKQIDRFIRQADRTGKLFDLSKHDDVFDPFLGVDRRAIEPEHPLKRYDHELSSCLEELRSTDFVTHSIDDCLHVVVLNRQHGISAEKGREIIKQYIQDKIGRPSSDEVDCRDVILSLESSFDYDTAMPIMLRPWLGEDIARVCLGQTEVYFGFDVNAWGRHLQSARLAWSSLREGRKELSKAADERLFLVCDRVPQIIGSNGESILLGTRFLQIMLCEGIRPISLAACYDQITDIEN